MKLNRLEFAVVNNSLRAAAQCWVETPLLLARPKGNDALADS